MIAGRLSSAANLSCATTPRIECDDTAFNQRSSSASLIGPSSFFSHFASNHRITPALPRPDRTPCRPARARAALRLALLCLAEHRSGTAPTLGVHYRRQSFIGRKTVLRHPDRDRMRRYRLHQTREFSLAHRPEQLFRMCGADQPPVDQRDGVGMERVPARSEEHTSELQSLMRISYAVFCLKKKQTRRNLLASDKTHGHSMEKHLKMLRKS